MLRSSKRPASETQSYWYDQRHHVWHRVEVFHPNESGTEYKVKFMDTQGIMNYIPQRYMFVDSMMIDTFEEDPNEVFTTPQLEYYKSIHEYDYTIKLHYNVEHSFFGRVLDNISNGPVHI